MEHLDRYFSEISEKIERSYIIGNKARSQGYDPELKVAIPLAKTMAERVEGLVSASWPDIMDKGIPQRIYELEREHGKLDWRVAFKISLEVAQQKFCKFDSQIKAMEVGIRVGIAYLTLGIVSSPLEGFVELKIKKRHDNKEYFCLMYSGPIRSAGGTAGAVSVIVADYIRKHMGYDLYDPDEREIRRTVTELYDYHERITNLQYLPSEREIRFLVKNLPVQVDGDPSEKIEVSNYKDLERIETNRIRNGVCLIIGECVAQKASKVWSNIKKWKDEFGLGHWEFMKEFVELQKEIKSAEKAPKAKDALLPVYTYIQDMISGRPVLTHPLRAGGFRLRYGKCRTSGYSAASIHPSTMHVLNKFIAVGTQLKLERPGKAASMTICDTIEGPIVKTLNGDVVFVSSESKAKEIASNVSEILFLGDILISYGDFANRAHPLVPCGYCEEWWSLEVEESMASALGFSDFHKLSESIGADESEIEKSVKEFLHNRPSADTAIKISEFLRVPLHPRYTYHWSTISKEHLMGLYQWLGSASIEKSDGKISKIVARNAEQKRTMELLGIPHRLINNEYVIVEGDDAQALAASLGLESRNGTAPDFLGSDMGTLEAVNRLSKVRLRDKSGTFIGARMGRPEKGKIRKLDGDPHTLFPVGEEGGKMRSFVAAIEHGKISSDFPLFFCNTCNSQTIFQRCIKCGSATEPRYHCKTCGIIKTEKCGHGTALNFCRQDIDIRDYFNSAMSRLKMQVHPDLIKGVRGTSNKRHMPENFMKGIIRAKHDVYVNKDGTTRYDMTQLPITHFRPKEIGTGIDRLKEMGYLMDIHGKELASEDQLLEILPQDIILPSCLDAPEPGADKIFHRVASFIDELLEKMYGLEPYYKVNTGGDLAGELFLILAPHTSAGIVGRLVGFSKTQCFYAHPMMHAATRRDCDGDEASATLLMDALLNFSREFLPNSRGSTQDAPLVLTSKILPTEVDDMLFDVDVSWRYPLEFYKACMEFRQPSKVPVERFASRLNTKNHYTDFGFTHDVSNINAGVRCSSYKTLPSMEDKLKGQMELADKIRAVDASDVARLVIEKHLIRDIKGNLRKFSTQQFRCSKCNEKFRRPPLAGVCTKCSGRIIFTVTEGSIVKYLEPALSLADKYNLPSYLKQTLDLVKEHVDSIFGKESERQEGLGRWFG
ncbi:DNA polymerase II large subunit [Candidatus Woesearchaeota archaeon]|nr:DNA polymerase II large subunit [Candidatus Woesearchaeota archaeon]